MKKVLWQSYFLTLLLATSAIIFLSCENSSQNSEDLSLNKKISNSNNSSFDIVEFERNKNLWTSQNIQNYKMIIGASGFITNFSEEVLIEVQNREAKSIKSLSKTGKNYTEAYKRFDSIEKIFNFVANNQKGHKLNVIFDKIFGYPSRVSYDEQAGIADDELELEVKRLEIIK